MAWDKSTSGTTPMSIPVAPGTVYTDQFFNNWNISRRNVDGELVLRPQSCDMVHQSTRHTVVPGSSGYWSVATYPGSDGLISYPNHMFPFDGDDRLDVAATNRARARFLGSARGTTASLGITFATWRQSRAMILNRASQLGGKLLGIQRELDNPRTLKRALARFSKDKGNLYLEGIFGWMPLIEDISAAIRVVPSETPKPTLIRGSAKQEASYRDFLPYHGSNAEAHCTSTGFRRTTITAVVDIKNHNAWLANRLGVLNAPAIAVDLIPWSWVVGMFWNQSAFIGQLTDTVGLEFRDMSVTKTSKGTSSWSIVGNGYHAGAIREGESSFRKKTRSLSSELPAVRPQARVPECDFALAATAMALVAQRSEKILHTVQKHTKQLREWQRGPVTD